MIKRGILIIILSISLSLIGCSEQKDQDGNAKGNVREDQDHISYSIWTTYWDTEDLDSEFSRIKNKIDKVSYFAAYFNSHKIAFIPKETIESFEKINDLYEDMEYNRFLTVVNDLMLPDGRTSLKDTDLIGTLFESDDAREEHIEDIIKLVTKEGFDGIEIDYEGIKNDRNLWEKFSKFIERLYDVAYERNIVVRVLLEPNAPVDEINLPNGPEYAIMCYNLYGFNTEPGPKANKEFIQEMIEKSTHLPGKVNFAIATGGFDFKDEGTVIALTEREAMELIAIYGENANRDKDSQAMFFNYIDGEGIHHEVWYADKDTIKYWVGIIQEAGHEKISIWKIGGHINLEDYL